MSLLSLPDELLVEISKGLSAFPFPLGRPMVELHPTLRALCATNQRLRALFMYEFYATVVFNLERKALRTNLQRVDGFLRVMKTRGASQSIRTIRLRDSEALPIRWPQRLPFGTSMMMDMSDEENALLHRILQVILSSATNLITLDMPQIDAPLTRAVIKAVNSHTCLREIILDDVQQLFSLPLTFLSSASLSRLHFRKGNLTDELDTPHTLPALQVVLARGSEGPHIYNLYIEELCSSAWTSLTIKGLRTLRVEWSNSDLSPSCGAFFDRHPQLNDIHLSGTGLRDIRAIERAPLLSSLYEAGARQGLLDSFRVDSVHVGNSDYYDFLEPQLCVREAKIRIMKGGADVVAFLLENLPFSKNLHLVCDKDANFVPMSDLWEAFLSSSSKLQYLRDLSITKFPLWDDPNQVPRLHLPPVSPRSRRSSDQDDYKHAPELDELGITIKDEYIAALADRCPSLSMVCIRGPEMEGVRHGVGFEFMVNREIVSRRIETIGMTVYPIVFLR